MSTKAHVSHTQPTPPIDDRGVSRRDVLVGAGAVAFGGAILGAASWYRQHERGLRAAAFIGRAESYDADLVSLVLDGLDACGFSRARVRGRTVLLKPNLVETAPGITHINTHPAVVLAAAEAFRRLDVANVIVAEGQGHRRDSWLVLDESGMGPALDAARLPFVDLNHDAVSPVTNLGGFTSLPQLYLPQTLLAADIVVSMPKLKTHHWAGVTCAMKNLFGVMPGIVYGWPKNVLHFAGIPKAILDIFATVRPHLAIVDGIVGMEGDGPIMGDPRPLGALIMGANFPAVDATCTRLMQLEPTGVEYLHHASGRFGPILAHNIEQRGEPVSDLSAPFAMLDLPHLSSVRGG